MLRSPQVVSYIHAFVRCVLFVENSPLLFVETSFFAWFRLQDDVVEQEPQFYEGYNPTFLDDPELRTGKHKQVISLPFVLVTHLSLPFSLLSSLSFVYHHCCLKMLAMLFQL